MTTTSSKAVPASVSDRLREDPELLEAVLDLNARLEMSDVLDALLTRFMEWSGASVGLAWGSGGEGRSFRRAAASFGRDDPRFDSIQKVKPETLHEWFGETPSFVEGLGPLATLVYPGIGRGARLSPMVAAASRYAVAYSRVSRS